MPNHNPNTNADPNPNPTLWKCLRGVMQNREEQAWQFNSTLIFLLTSVWQLSTDSLNTIQIKRDILTYRPMSES